MNKLSASWILEADSFGRDEEKYYLYFSLKGMTNEGTAMNTWKYGRPKNLNQRNNASAYLMEQLMVGNSLHGAFNNIRNISQASHLENYLRP